MKRLIGLFLAVVFAGSCSAQQGGYIHGNGDPRTVTPTPNCASSRFYVDDSTGLLYQANSGSPCVWTPGGGTTPAPSLSTAANTIIPTAAPYNASGFIAISTTASSVSSGATAIPVDSAAMFSAGQIVIVALGGTSGTKDFAGFISSVNYQTNTITLSNVAVSGNLLPSTATSGTSGIAATVPAGYLVYSLGTTTLSAPAASGANVIELANATSYLPGQGILIFGGGASSVNLLSTITGVAGDLVFISPGIANASGVASGAAVQHDDTAAFQKAVNGLSITQNLKIMVPDGYYQFNPPTVTSAGCAVQFPSILYYGNTSFGGWALPQATLEISGYLAAPQDQAYSTAYSMPHVSGVVFKTSLSYTGSNPMWSVFCAYDANSGSSFSNVQLVTRGITWRSYPNPQIILLNAGLVESLKLYDSDFDTGETGPTSAGAPTTTNFQNYALLGPQGDNGSNNLLSNVEFMGGFFGPEVSEHTRLEHIRFDNIDYPLLLGFNSGDQTKYAQAFYSMTGVDLSFDGCTHGIAAWGNTVPIKISLEAVNFEHHTTPAWVTNVNDVNDPSNVLYGTLVWEGNGAAPANTIVLDGGSNLNIVSMMSSANCASLASPAVCASADAGSVAVPAAGTTLVVDTAAVTANSDITVAFDSSLGTKLGVTCNTTINQPSVSARIAGTSFTITMANSITTNPDCISYQIRH